MSLSEAYKLAGKQIGLNETDQKVALQDYLSTGGQNIDPVTRAWCADFVNATLQQTGLEGTGSGAARSFLDWGVGVDEPQVGDIAVFSRGNPSGPYGHVGFFEGYDDAGNIIVLGGNQGDAVSRKSYDASRLLGFRRAEGGKASGLAGLDEAMLKELAAEKELSKERGIMQALSSLKNLDREVEPLQVRAPGIRRGERRDPMARFR